MAAIGLSLAEVQAQAAAQLIGGAVLEFYEGQRPDQFGMEPQGKLLVAFQLDQAFAVGPSVRVENLDDFALGDGRPSWYRVRAGAAVLVEGGADEIGFVRSGEMIVAGARVLLQQYEYRVNQGGA